MGSSNERDAALLCVVLGFIVTGLLTSKYYFWGNFIWYWGPQLGVLAFTWLFRGRPALVAGTAIALAIYFAAFHTWVFTRVHPQSMMWLIYLFSMPGAVWGTIEAADWLRDRPHLSPFTAGLIGTAAVLTGIALNQLLFLKIMMSAD